MPMINTALLRLRRKELNITQEEACSRIGVSRSQYTNIEVGKSFPSIPVLCSMVKELGIPFEEMFGLIVTERAVRAKEERLNSLKERIGILQSEIDELKNSIRNENTAPDYKERMV